MTHELTLYGKLIAKKNRPRPSRNGGIYYDDSTVRQLAALALQVPGELRGLRLEHPDLEVRFTLPEGRSDRDNMLTALLDILTQTAVIRNDSVASFNGRWIIPEASYGDTYITEVLLTENPANGWEEKRKHGKVKLHQTAGAQAPRRHRRAAGREKPPEGNPQDELPPAPDAAAGEAGGA